MKTKGTQNEAQIRCFVAIEIDREIRSNLDKIISELKPRVADVKWVKTNGIHLTLKFLGNVAESMIPSLRSVMAEVASSVKPFKIVVKGLGAFPNPNRARVVWVGLDEPTGILQDTAKRIGTDMERLGFERESRGFRPHLTLGRVRRDGRPGKELKGLIDSDRERQLGSFTATGMVLFQSDLKPGGAIYTKLETTPFA